MRVTMDGRWLLCDLGRKMRILSWALNRPGFCTGRHILWRKVNDSDLPPGRDAGVWLRGQLAARAMGEAPCMLTSRQLDAHVIAQATVEGITAHCVTTVGLSNAERVGTRRTPPASPIPAIPHPGPHPGPHPWGTINIALSLDCGLNEGALLECLSIIAEARSIAVSEAALALPTGLATGTGTDCIALAAPAGNIAFAGLHTAPGEAAGAAVLAAMKNGLQGWMDTATPPPTGQSERKGR